MSGLQFSDDTDFEMDDEPKTPEIYHKRPTSKAAPDSNKSGGNRTLRIRPMSVAMREKHPDVLSITLTRTDGRQLIFVRK
jgi:hypothetical protein